MPDGKGRRRSGRWTAALACAAAARRARPYGPSRARPHAKHAVRNISVRAVPVAAAAFPLAGLLAACGGSPARPAPAPAPASPAAGAATAVQPGGASSSQAVDGFLRAAQTTDARTMSGYFGTRDGPTTGRDPAADVEKRMIALACYLQHDSDRVLGDVPGVGTAGDRTVTVELRQRELVRQTRFTVVPGPGGRWFVQAFDIDAVSDLCRPR